MSPLLSRKVIERGMVESFRERSAGVGENMVRGTGGCHHSGERGVATLPVKRKLDEFLSRGEECGDDSDEGRGGLVFIGSEVLTHSNSGFPQSVERGLV